MKTNLLIALLIAATTNCLAQFLPSENFTETTNPYFREALAVADMNGDGIEDVVSLRGDDGLFTIALGDGYSFGEVVQFPFNLPGYDVQSVDLSDMDHDGDIDVMMQAGWIENESFDFTQVHRFTPDHYTSGLFIMEDYNGDTFDDVLIIDFFNGIDNALILLNDGLGNLPTVNYIVPLTFNAGAFYSADINGDGYKDFATRGNSPNDLNLYINDGSGDFYPGTTLDSENVVGMLDADGDGFADILKTAEGLLSIEYGNGDLTFDGAVNVYLGGNEFFAPINRIPTRENMIDYDGDGDLDLIGFCEESTYAIIYNNNGIFEFGVEGGNYWSGGSSTEDQVFMHLNGDQRYDLVLTSDLLACTLQDENGIQVAHDVISEGFMTQEFEYPLLALDQDKDGDLDFFTGGRLGLGYYENQDMGHFSEANFAVYNSDAVPLGTMDLNQDGLDDIIYQEKNNEGGYTHYAIKYSLNIDDGKYAPAIEIFNHYAFHTYMLFDIDLDGVKDIIDFKTLGNNEYENKVAWYHFDLTNGVSEEHVLATWIAQNNEYGLRTKIRQGDYNGDGYQDFVVASGKEIRIFEYDINGQFNVFNPQENPIAGDPLIAELVASENCDLNGDGIVDIPMAARFNYAESWAGPYRLGYFTKQNGVYQRVMLTMDETLDTSVFSGNHFVDFDLDGDQDVCVLSYDVIKIFLNEGNDIFVNSFETTLGLVNPQFQYMYLADFNNDLLADIIVGTGDYSGPLDYHTALNNITSPNQIHCHVFIDDNGNGVMDNDEVGIENRQIQFQDNWGYYYTDENGEYTLFGLQGDYIVSINPHPALWNQTTPWVQNVTLDSNNPEVDLYFGMQPLGVQYVVSSTISDIGAPCGSGSPRWITVTNTGNQITSGHVFYHPDPLYVFDYANPAPELLPDGSLQWDFTHLYYGEQLQIEVWMINPDYTHMGEILSYSIVTTCVAASGNILDTYTNTFGGEWTCSNDPNSMEESNGLEEAGYILDDGLLHYTVHFQNLGNGPAQNIRIEDPLSELLDWSTVQPIAASADYTTEISANGRMTFRFENINLPGVNSDPLGSNGYITFTVKPVVGLPIGTIIHNKADIFFDYNDAVETNTTQNTIYNCSDLEQNTVSETSVCVGEEITVSNSSIWVESLIWTFNGNELGEDDFTFPLNETGVLNISLSNALCEFSENFNLVANVADASFTASGNLLSAIEAISYQWYLNGNEIEGAISQNYEISQSGNFSLSIFDSNGCSALSNATYINYLTVQEQHENPLLIYPNPANDFITLVISERMSGKSVSLCDITGQIILQPFILKSTNTSLNISSLAPGVYWLTGDEIKARLVIQ